MSGESNADFSQKNEVASRDMAKKLARPANLWAGLEQAVLALLR